MKIAWQQTELQDFPQPVAGLRMSHARAGLYGAAVRADMALLEAAAGSCFSLQMTRNRFAAAPISWIRQQSITRHSPDKIYALVNAGNANAGTGERGLNDIDRLHDCLRGHVGSQFQFLPFSTGVIGEYLPVESMSACLGQLVDQLSPDAKAWDGAAAAILTTDTASKIASIELKPSSGQSQPIRVCGIAKGSGMIHPDMATMLCFIACDARPDPEWFYERTSSAVQNSFNCISVDGDTSTNDACLSLATGANPAKLEKADWELLAQAIEQVMQSLAVQIISDGEGASVVFCVRVQGAPSCEDAAAIAKTVANSPLVKTAIGARDPNWGRILAAVGRAPVEQLDVTKVDIYLNDARIVCQGQRCSEYQEHDGQDALRADNININIDLNSGNALGHCYACDLSAEYVRINRSYRS